MDENQLTSVTIAFDASLFSSDAVKRAVYRFLDVFAAEITSVDNSWSCVLKFHAPKSPQEIERCINELRTEVLDQDLRASIAKETASVRNTILALAFSRTGLGDP